MGRLPGAEDAILDQEKLAGYLLNPLHPRGRHKARTFKAALGVDRQDADWVRKRLLIGIRRRPAECVGDDARGRRYQVDIPLKRGDASAVARTFWIINRG